MNHNNSECKKMTNNLNEREHKKVNKHMGLTDPFTDLI